MNTVLFKFIYIFKESHFFYCEICLDMSGKTLLSSQNQIAMRNVSFC